VAHSYAAFRRKGGLPFFIRALTFALLAVPPASFAQTAASLAKTVDARYNHLQSLSARYTERYQGMGMDRSESGTLLLKKPGRMRWSYDTPAGKLFLLDGKNAIFYTPGDAQATRIPAKQLDDLRSPLRFLLGHTELAKELDHLSLTLVTDRPPAYNLSGVPKGMSQRLRSLTLTVDATGLIHAMRLEETDGSLTTFTFTDIHENVPANDSDFTFTPPPGVGIVAGSPPI
jgi:outer membrane lipoprotein carrier protein